MKEQVKIVVPSHKRAGKVSTHKRVANITLTCEERQVPAYAAAHPDLAKRIVAHPNDLDLMQTWEWVMKEFPSHFWLDDDLLGIFRIYRWPGAWKKAVLSPQRAYEVIQRTAETAKELGAYLFGFGKHAHPVTFDGLRPFRLGGFTVGGAYGLLEGHSITPPPEPVLSTGSDYWLCALNAYFHRYAFFDCRFAAGFGETYTGSGGLAEERGESFEGDEAEVAATHALRRYFGEVIEFAGDHQVKTVTKRNRNAGRRRMTLPYKT